MKAVTSPIRVLHVLGRLDRGGAETWMLHVLRHVDREAFRMDFLVHSDMAGAYDEEARALGSKILPCPHFRRPWRYARDFRAILRRHGPYHVVHSHVHGYSGWVLRLAHRAGVPVRIAHSHNDTSRSDAHAGAVRRGYLALMKRWIDCHATIGLAASGRAGESLFGGTWSVDPRWQVLFCGIDLAPFQQEVDSRAVRAELHIPPNAFVVGHVGRFDDQKNHAFLVDILAALARRIPDVVLLLVGQGAPRPAIEAKVKGAGLADRVVYCGPRGDVPRLMLGAMDVFVLPSRFEGLPLALVEAQAAGLRCVISDVIAEESTVVESLVRRVSLARPAAQWAREILALREDDLQVSPAEACGRVACSPLNIEVSVRQLERLYRVHACDGAAG